MTQAEKVPEKLATAKANSHSGAPTNPAVAGAGASPSQGAGPQSSGAQTAASHKATEPPAAGASGAQLGQPTNEQMYQHYFQYFQQAYAAAVASQAVQAYAASAAPQAYAAAVESQAVQAYDASVAQHYQQMEHAAAASGAPVAPHPEDTDEHSLEAFQAAAAAAVAT